jgi:hypothetical protein
MRTVVAFAVMFLLAGCGGGNKPSDSPTDVSGTWNIILTENQALTVSLTHSGSIAPDPNPTEIAIALSQSNGILIASGKIYSGNTGCKSPSWSWYNTGPYPSGWNFGTDSFAFDSGLVSGNNVTLNLVEAENFQNVPPLQSGTLKLVGTEQNGTIAGTFTDTCVPIANGSAHSFPAVKIATFRQPRGLRSWQLAGSMQREHNENFMIFLKSIIGGWW